MMLSRVAVHVAVLLVVLRAAAPTTAQQTTAPFEPQVGQSGKDVVWVPTPQELVDKMLDMAQVTPTDYLIDLGSGDGVTVISAAKRGARAHGIEYDPRMVELATRNAATAQVSSRATFAKADLFESDFSKADVITMFLLPSINLRLRPKILALAPGTRVVSNTFTMDEWEPDDKATISPCERWCTALLWIVPGQVAGRWRSAQGDLALTQRFQMVSGTLGSDAVSDGRLRGREIRFSAGGGHYVGQMEGNRIRGTKTVEGRSVEWTARR